MKKEKDISIKKWLGFNFHMGFDSFWTHIVKYGVVLLLSFLATRFLAQYEDITKWVIFGFWILLNIGALVWHILITVYSEYELYLDGEVKTRDGLLDGKTYKQAMKLVNKLRRKGFFIKIANGLISMFPFYLIVGAGYLVSLYFSNHYAWASLAKFSFEYELYALILVHLVAFLVCIFSDCNENPFDQRDLEDATRRYYWEECVACGGLSTCEVLSAWAITEKKDIMVQAGYTATNQVLESFVVNKTRYDVIGDKKVAPKYKTETTTRCMGKVQYTCQKCGVIHSKNINLRCSPDRVFYRLDGKKVGISTKQP